MDKADLLNDIIARLKASRDAEEVRQIYRDWSASYDEDLAGFGYVAPQIGAEIFDQAFVRQDGLIFDAGCGTGLSGQALAERGYTRLHGGDFSPDMLAQARKSGHYQKLIEVDFRYPLDLTTARYDGVTCFGVYKSTFKEYFLQELIRLTKPGGIVCLSCRFDYFEDDLLLQAQAQKRIGALTIESIDTKPYMTGQQANAAYIVLRKM